jgi:hypothetical protein
MSKVNPTIQRVREAASQRILFLPHAVRQMARPDRMITPSEVRSVVLTGGLIEDYPDDPRGESCLLLGFGDGGRPVHVVCAPKPEYLAIVTAYLPDPREWTDGFTGRNRP